MDYSLSWLKKKKCFSQVAYIGKKKKGVFSITKAGREEFKTWFESPTGSETLHNKFLPKLFFVTDRKVMARLLQERLGKVEGIHEE